MGRCQSPGDIFCSDNVIFSVSFTLPSARYAIFFFFNIVHSLVSPLYPLVNSQFSVFPQYSPCAARTPDEPQDWHPP